MIDDDLLSAQQEVAMATGQLASIADGDANEELVECLFLVVEYHYLLHTGDRSADEVHRAVRLARRINSPRLLRKALNYLGVFLKERGEFAGALAAQLESMQIVRTQRDRAMEASAWNNIATTLMACGQFQAALPFLQRAITLSRECIPYVFLNALANAAACALRLGQVELGIDCAGRALERFANEVPSTALLRHTRVVLECNYARLLLDAGRVLEAWQHLNEAQRFDSAERARVFRTTTAGLLRIGIGEYDRGLEELTGALQYARERCPGELGEALAECASGFEAAGRPDAALGYLHELIAFSRERHAARLTMCGQLTEQGLYEGNPKGDDARWEKAAARLEAEVEERLRRLVETAVNAAISAGHDLYRPFRVGKLAEIFASSEGLAENERSRIGLSGKLADVGMVAISPALLNKIGVLSRAERRIVDEHTRISADLLSGARLSALQSCISVARFHHERWDGSGPWAMVGDEIPFEARLVGLCDSFDSLTHDRPWRKAASVAGALIVIERERGSKFDPQLAMRFARFVREEFWRHEDLEAFLATDAHQNSYVRTREQITAMMKGLEGEAADKGGL